MVYERIARATRPERTKRPLSVTPVTVEMVLSQLAEGREIGQVLGTIRTSTATTCSLHVCTRPISRQLAV